MYHGETTYKRITGESLYEALQSIPPAAERDFCDLLIDQLNHEFETRHSALINTCRFSMTRGNIFNACRRSMGALNVSLEDEKRNSKRYNQEVKRYSSDFDKDFFVEKTSRTNFKSELIVTPANSIAIRSITIHPCMDTLKKYAKEGAKFGEIQKGSPVRNACNYQRKSKTYYMKEAESEI